MLGKNMHGLDCILSYKRLYVKTTVPLVIYTTYSRDCLSVLSHRLLKRMSAQSNPVFCLTGYKNI